MSDLRQRIETARDRLRSGRFSNEASISTGIVLPILDALGWDAFDPNEVAPEYKVKTRRVDFALVTKGRPAVFVEVKQPGMADGADQQLFEYAFMEGVPLAVLTDGATWSIYVPAEQGSMEERRAYHLDLAERTPSESADRLLRYLERDAVVSGEAFERARRDCKSAKQSRGARAALPQAWANLVASQDAAILDRLAAEVESVSGFQSEPADLAAFLATLAPASGALPKGKKSKPRKHTPAKSEPTKPTAPEASGAKPDASGLPARGFEIGGRFVAATTGINLLEGVFQELHQRDPSFLDRFVALNVGKKRRFVAETRSALYPGRPDLEKMSRKLGDYWLATNNSTETKKGLLREAAQLAGLTLGTDLKVRFEK